MEMLLKKIYEYKRAGRLGPGCERTECVFLNRVIRHIATADGTQMELDARHIEVASREGAAVAPARRFGAHVVSKCS